jgi:NAD(P)-dependent dehydrogenase (short-subunit alcohol dehydrogenase family)
MARWTVSDIPSQSGRTAIVTGTGGLGYQTALELVRKGGDVTLVGRNAEKGAEAVRTIRAAVPPGKVRFELVDLASLASIKAFGARMGIERQSLDLLVNNAGVMAPPQRRTTSDGFELQFGTNYLGHFALTATLWPLLRRGHTPRVTHVSSIAHRMGTIDFDDLQSEVRYKPMAAYNVSKLANLVFAFELQRRSDAARWAVTSTAAHPGMANTELAGNGPGRHSLMARLFPVFGQPAASGALPILYAATSPDAKPQGYYGPDGLFEMKGSPKSATIAARAKNMEVAARLWETSLRLTGVTYE